jgi:hypothetical protein
MRVVQHFLYFGSYFLFVLTTIGKSRFVVIEQCNVARFPDPPATDQTRYVPSDLKDRLESLARATAPAWNCFETVGFVVLRVGGHWRIP